MKYWMFQNNQVTGPYEPDDLPTVSGYGAETLVCPEGRKGTSMGDWQRASMVPELSVSLLKVAQLATVLKGSGNVMAGLPPEPTLKDLAALGSLQERVELLDNVVAQLQESLKLKDQELLSVHRELDQKEQHAKALAVKLGEVEERFTQVNALKEGLDKAVAAEHDVESSVQSQARTIEELTKQLADLQAEKARLESAMAGKDDLEQLKAQVQEIKDRPAPAMGGSPSPQAPFGNASAPAGKPEPGKDNLPSLDLPAPAASPFGPKTDAPKSEPFSLQPPKEGAAPLASPEPAAGPGGFAPLGTSAVPTAEKLGAPTLSASFPSAPSPIPETTPPIAETSGGSPTPKPASGQALPDSTPAPVVPATQTGGEKKKPNVFLFIVLAIGALGGFAAIKLGLVGGKRKSAPAALTDRAPLPPPTPVETPKPVIPPPPSPEEILDGKKKEAIALTQGWPVPGGKTVGEAAAEGTVPPDGALSPWMAEPLEGRDGAFQVNFYAQRAGLPSQTYEFEADLPSRKVAAHNALAKDLLEGKATTPKKRRKSKRAAKPKVAKQPADDGKPLLEDILIVNPDDDQKVPTAASGGDIGSQAPALPPSGKKPAAGARKSRIKAQEKEKSLDDLLSDAQEPAPRPKVRPKEAKKDESLDELLVPGSGKGQLDEPQAQPAEAPKSGGDAAETAADENPNPPPAKKPAKQPGSDQLLDDLLNQP